MEISHRTQITPRNPVTGEKLSRRGFLEIGTKALAVAGVAPAILAAGQYNADRSSSDPGPSNSALDAQNSDALMPPVTDPGGVPAFKYPFSFSNKRVYAAGWSPEATVRGLPIAKA